MINKIKRGIWLRFVMNNQALKIAIELSMIDCFN